ncbi:hypothetical protein AALO_G00091870 [Alosa alosa]|uniref:PiggyBac transposable element-derived protein domain-containing protein n=1 Tax=Alosa alosa TaxID=278164 RepID=A0AAV6GV99_9TELE|nr:hypothetical protein AALO_G00091870 [Alosa alosa]
MNYCRQLLRKPTSMLSKPLPAETRANLQGRRVHSWRKVTVQELRQFFGLFFLTGIVKKPSLASYWSTDEVVSTPHFNKTMARNRFQQIWSFLHFSDNQANNGTDRLYKVRPVLDYVLSKFDELYQPNSNICIDEGTMAWRGRLTFKVYNPQKPIKYGIKSYIICDSETGYCFGMKPYCGEAGNLEDTVVTLLGRLAGQGYKLYMDNFYNSVALADRLLQMDTHICGTLRKNRGEPQTITNISNSDLGPGEVIALHNNTVMVLAWRDKKIVKMITSLHQDEMQTAEVWQRGHNERVPVQKPACIVAFNHSMNGVDRLDQNITYYPCVRKSAKWTNKFVLYLFQICLFNSFILYKARNPQGEHRKFLPFILSVVRSLTTRADEDAGGEEEVDIGRPNKDPRAPSRDPQSRLTGGVGVHVMAKYKATRKKKHPARVCRVCKKRGYRSETTYYCTSCVVPLHLKECYTLYHTQTDFATHT